MPKIKIDNQEIEVLEHTTVLEAAKQLGIEIPTLCAHEAIEPYGACRLCIVELKSGDWSKLMTACTYPVWDGLEVITNSEKILQARRFIIELLLARCPNSKEIQDMAKKLGVERSRLKTTDPDEKCILCGLCVRVCKEMIGSSAIGFINRGIERKVETPFEVNSKDCIGCGACAFVCPTGVIRIEDIKGNRKIETWHTDLKLVKCKGCGAEFNTAAVVKLLKKKSDLLKDAFDNCTECRRKELKKKMIEIASPQVAGT